MAYRYLEMKRGEIYNAGAAEHFCTAAVNRGIITIQHLFSEAST
jgi:formylmethanofuran dehydrogenase subunit C